MKDVTVTMHKIEPVGKIKIYDIDEPCDTYITLGCHRETHRLQRMLSVYRKAMTLATGVDREYGEIQSCLESHAEGLRNNLISLHDRKGRLTADWKNEKAVKNMDLTYYVYLAWVDEGEEIVTHICDGKWFAGEKE